MQKTSQEVIALLAQPIAGNPAQFVIEKALAALGLDHRYLSLEVAAADLAAAVEGARVMGFRGIHLDEPHRAPIVNHAAGDEFTTHTGAANLLVRNDDGFRAQNTLGAGCVAAIQEHTPVAGKRVTLLGAGKMARSVAAELAQSGVTQLIVVNRTPEHAVALTSGIREQFQIDCTSDHWNGDCPVADDCDLLIHATSLAEADPAVRVPVAGLRRELLVVDVTLDPHTTLLREARSAGAPTIDGLAIYVRHVAKAIEIWTGKSPDLALMREALEEFLEV
jgi:shikimate dehydrogenase